MKTAHLTCVKLGEIGSVIQKDIALQIVSPRWSRPLPVIEVISIMLASIMSTLYPVASLIELAQRVNQERLFVEE